MSKEDIKAILDQMSIRVDKTQGTVQVNESPALADGLVKARELLSRANHNAFFEAALQAASEEALKQISK